MPLLERARAAILEDRRLVELYVERVGKPASCWKHLFGAS